MLRSVDVAAFDFPYSATVGILLFDTSNPSVCISSHAGRPIQLIVPRSAHFRLFSLHKHVWPVRTCYSSEPLSLNIYTIYLNFNNRQMRSSNSMAILRFVSTSG